MSIVVSAAIDSKGATAGAAQFNAALASMRQGLVGATASLATFQSSLTTTRAQYAAQSAGISGWIASLTRLRTLFAGFAAFKVGQWAVQASDDFTTLAARLSIVANEGTSAVSLLDSIAAAAQRARVPALDLARIFQRNANALRDLGRSEAEGIRLTETLAKVTAISGVSAVEASSAMRQLSQAIVSNRLQGDEFRSIAENLPEVLRILQTETGKTGAELRKLSRDGQLTGEVLVNALLNASKSVDERFARVPMTAAAAWGMLQDSLSRTFGEMAAGNGVSQRFADLFESIRKHIEAPEFAQASARVAEGIALVARTMTTMVGAATEARRQVEAFNSALQETTFYKVAAAGLQTLADAFQRVVGIGRQAATSAADAVRQAVPDLDSFLTRVERTADAAHAAAAWNTRVSRSTIDPADTSRRLNIPIGGGVDEDAIRKVQRLIELQDLRNRRTEALIEGEETIAHTIENQLELRQRITDSLRNIPPSLKNQLAAQIALTNELNRQLERARQLRELGADTFRTISNGILEGIKQGQKFTDVLRNMGVKLLEIAANAAFLNPLEKAFSNTFSSTLSSAGFDPAKGLLGGLGIPGLASGGVLDSPGVFVSGGTHRQIAENGPEAVLPLKRGAGGQLGVAMTGGAQGASQVFNFNIAGDATDATVEKMRRMVRQEIVGASPALVRSAVSSVGTEHRRNPNYLRR